MHERPTILIVGAGFSGTVLAVRLLRAGKPVEVVLVNRSGRMARGVAYGTRSDLHVLNVPAGRMSAFPEDEDDFLRFARAANPDIVGGTFVRRSLYGDYLQNLLDSAVNHAQTTGGQALLRQVVGQAVDIEPIGGRYVVRVALTGDSTTAAADPITADAVVIASGNYPPADPMLGSPAVLHSDRYVRDPWAPQALAGVKPDEEVLLIGTGLTMFDVALELSRRRGVTRLHAVSRRGLLPQPHRFPAAPPANDHRPPDLFDGEPTVLHYLRSVRRHVKAVAARGVDWRDVIASLRPITPALWQRLPAGERRRFLAALRPYWDVHRHRAAPEINAAIQSLIRDGQLTVSAGRVAAAKEHHGKLEVVLRLRRGGESRELRVDRVINCTGPDCSVSTIRDPLLESLRKRGLCRPDEIGMGFETDDDLRLLSAGGEPQRGLYLLGPLLRGKFWEATAVPELRVHAAEVARRLLP